MMEVSEEIVKEADVLAAFAFVGMALLLAYDMLRIIRRLFPHKSWAVGAEDLLFWIAGAVALFAMLCRENSGRIRGFAVLGVLLGMAAYHLAFSVWVVKGGVFLLGKILHIAGRPLVWTARLLRRPWGFLKRFAKKTFRFLKKRLQNLCKAVKMGLCKL